MKTPLALAVLFLAGVANAEETIKPGYWEAEDKVTSPFPSSKVERRCIEPKDVARFMTCYINHHYTCQCPEQSYTGGQIRYRGVCVDNKGAQVGITGRGTYTATTLHLTADVTFKLAGIPISGQASTDAHRLGDICPADQSSK